MSKGLWHNIRKNRGSGKKPTPEMLEQERKIKAKTGKGKKYPDGLKKKITGFAETNKEELGIRGGVNYGGTNLSGDLSKYYKNLSLNQKIPINKNLNVNLGLDSGNLTKFQGKRNFKPGFNVGITRTFPDGKGKKNVVYVPDEETLKLEQQARIDSTNSATRALELKAKLEQESADYEANVKRLDSMTNEEYDAEGESVEAEGDSIAKESMETRNKILELEKKYGSKKIQPSERVKSKFLGADQYVPSYSFPSTTVELKKQEEKEEEEKEEFDDVKEKQDALDSLITASPAPAPIVKKAIPAVRKITPLEEEKPKTDYRGKIKYVIDGTGPTKYFFIDSLGRQNGITKAEAERRQAQDKTEIVEVMKKKKMPMGMKYSNGKKYSYKGGRKYALGAAIGALGKVGGALGTASKAAGFIGQFGASGNEKANKVAGILNSANSLTDTLGTSMAKKNDATGGTETAEQTFRKGRMFPYGKGNNENKRLERDMKKDRKAEEKKELKSMTSEQRKLKKEVDKIKKENVKGRKKQATQFSKEKKQQKKAAMRDTKTFEKENPNRDINYDEYSKGKKGVVVRGKVREYR